MELNWLEDFVALAETGNFSRAAENRHVTQPAFSRRVRALEDWIGAQLFERTAHGVTLTAAGEQFRSGADELIRRMNQLRREAREAGGKEMATLRFAATHALSFTFFPQWIREMESRALGVCPSNVHRSEGESTASPFFIEEGHRTSVAHDLYHVTRRIDEKSRRGSAAVDEHYSDRLLGSIRLISDSMQACEELMLHGQAQFLLCHYHPAAPGRFAAGIEFKSTTVGRDALIPFVAPDETGAPKWRLTESAAKVPYLEYSEESGLGRIVAASHFEHRAAGLHGVFSARLAVTLMTMAKHGRGVAWLPATLAADDVARGHLVRAADEGWEVEVDIRVFRPAARQSLAAESFWGQLAAPEMPGSLPSQG